ncbi:MAG: NfeD family protein [Variovorax sp.]
MANSTVWWLIAGGAIVVELMSGTIYLLLLSAGFAAAAIAAHAGFGTVVQIFVAALVGMAAVLVWRVSRRNAPPEPPPSANPNVNLDIGEQVFIPAWNPDGTAFIRYRGAQWTAVPTPGSVPVAGEHRVAQMVGSRLVVDKI